MLSSPPMRIRLSAVTVKVKPGVLCAADDAGTAPAGKFGNRLGGHHIGGPAAFDAAAFPAGIYSGSQHYIIGIYGIAGAAGKGDGFFVFRAVGFFLNCVHAGVLKNACAVLFGSGGDGMNQAEGIRLGSGSLGIDAGFNREGKLPAGLIGIEQLRIDAVMHAQGIFPPDIRGVFGLFGIAQAVHPTETAVVAERGAEGFYIINGFPQQAGPQSLPGPPRWPPPARRDPLRRQCS